MYEKRNDYRNDYKPDPGRDPWDPWEAPGMKITAAYRADGLTDGVIVPVLRAVFLGVTTGILAGLLCWQLKWPAGLSPWMAWLIVTFAVMAFTFLAFTQVGQNFLERITGVDLNKDGTIGGKRPTLPSLPKFPNKVHLELVQDGGNTGDYIDLPATPEQLKALATGLVNQKSQFALTTWAGAGGQFTRPEFEQLRSVLIERGLARWKNEKSPNQGAELTPQGYAVMRYIASDHYRPPTTPQAQD